MGGYTRNDILLFLSIWIGLLVTAFLLLLPILPPVFAAGRAVELLGMIACGHYANAYLFKRTIAAGKPGRYIARAALMIVALSFLRFLLESFVFPTETQPAFFKQSAFRPVFFLASTGFVALVSTAFLYIDHTAQKEQLLLKQLSANNEARLQYLQQQINPHFLFNALNNIYSLVITKSNQAPEKLLQLTSLLRHSVYQKPGDKVSVRDEAEQIEFLIELYCLRRDEPYQIAFEKKDLQGSIEPMILIPLAENCLKHCDFDLNDKAYMKLYLETDTTGLRFTTENTFNPLQTIAETGGVGLQNIQERLQLIYGNNHSLHISSNETVFKVELNITWNR